MTVDDHWRTLGVARACIATIPNLRAERANLVAELVTCGEPVANLTRLLGVNRQRVHQLAQSATELVPGTVTAMWDRLEIVHALLVDGRGCYERQRAAMRALVDAGVPRQEIAVKAGVTVAAIAYVLKEIDRTKKASA